LFVCVFENSKGLWGAFKSRFFEPGFMLFDAILTAVFENENENYSRDLFRAFFAQKVVFGKVTYGPFDVFVRVFNSEQLS
jgi:hypothetical protein